VAINIGDFDRATRMTLGIMMLALALSGTVAGPLGAALGVLGALLLISGTAGRCLVYRLLGIDTARRFQAA
jgi:hypothetical protein